tara:strand:- start:266 stop:427 length:162 start_codon:yes stop_codon:yes gene_type:complete
MDERIKELQYSVEAFKNLCLETKNALEDFNNGALSDSQRETIGNILYKLKDVE